MSAAASRKKKETPAAPDPSSPSVASASVEEQLARYRAMRDFHTTAEPRGQTHSPAPVIPPEGLPFVIQKHAATRLHYDFRLGWRGVLKSWAVAKGPSYVVKDKRLAVQVEDHPIEYGGFEGTIPKGQYGGGTVMVWDQGTWEPVGDADEGLRTGRLKFILHGNKLQGHWTLIRMGGHAAEEKKPNWLLIKEHDEYERSENAEPITEEKPDSVVTGRDLAAIARDEDHVWNSNHGMAADERKKAEPASTAAAKARSRAAAATSSSPRTREPGAQWPVAVPRGAPREKLPGFIEPQLASQVDKPPASPDWVHELKLDGYRIQAHLEHGSVALLTRKGLDWTHRMKRLAASIRHVPAKAAVLDGEVVVLDAAGLSSFAELQAAFQEGTRSELIYYVFDLLHLDGHSLRDLPLSDRKAKLAELLASFDPAGDVRISEHIEGESTEIFAEACRLGAEGIISKESKSAYISGRSSSWLKAKCSRHQEFVIGGFTLPSDNGNGIGALLIGYYREGKLMYAGRTGTGFTQKSSRAVRERLEKLRTDSMPFAQVDTAARRGALWVTPKLVAEVAFRTWTKDNVVRQASFKGLREDKPATEVQREITESIQTATKEAAAESSRTGSRATHQRNAAAQAASPPRSSPQMHHGARSAHFPELPPSLRLSHPEKLLDAESGLTKQVLAEYYAAVADRMLPHIADRPLSIVRCPGGTASKCFFQKHVKVGLPKDIGSVEIADKKGGPPEPYITLSKPEALIGLSQMNVLELHPWGSRNEDYERPDRLIFDLDPDPSVSWSTVTAAAEEVRTRLRKIELECFLKSTGGKGLHLVAPIAPDYDWSTLKAFAHAFVQAMEKENPRLYLTKMSKAARKDRIYLDYLRNERGATAVAPYSPRSRSGVPVSVPLAWSELKQPVAPRLLVAQFKDWLPERKLDPWKQMLTSKQTLAAEVVEAFTNPPKPGWGPR